jgi:hypothetical protein
VKYKFVWLITCFTDFINIYYDDDDILFKPNILQLLTVAGGQVKKKVNFVLIFSFYTSETTVTGTNLPLPFSATYRMIIIISYYAGGGTGLHNDRKVTEHTGDDVQWRRGGRGKGQVADHVSFLAAWYSRSTTYNKRWYKKFAKVGTRHIKKRLIIHFLSVLWIRIRKIRNFLQDPGLWIRIRVRIRNWT